MELLLQPNAQNLDVHEEADEVFGLFTAVGARRADGEVALAGEAVEQAAEDAEQQHVEGDVLADAEGVSAGGEIGRDEQGLDVAGEVGAVGGERGGGVRIVREMDGR